MPFHYAKEAKSEKGIMKREGQKGKVWLAARTRTHQKHSSSTTLIQQHTTHHYQTSSHFYPIIGAFCPPPIPINTPQCNNRRTQKKAERVEEFFFGEFLDSANS